MDTAADASLRWTRAAALATVAVLVAVWAHVGADGRLPSAPVLLAVVLAMTVAVQPLLARPASAVRVLLLTVGGQAVAHAALSLTAGHGRPPLAATSGPPHHSHGASSAGHASAGHASAGHGEAGHGLAEGATAATDPVAHLVSDVAAAGLPMVLTHLAAAVLVGAWLAVGERAVWTVLTLAWRALTLRVGVVRPCAAPRPLATLPVVTTMVCRVTIGSVVRRGPPSLLAA